MRAAAGGRQLIVGLTALLLLVGCSSNDPSNDAAPASAATAVVENATGIDADESAADEDDDASETSADFCGPANAFVTATAVRLVASPDAGTFVDIDQRLAALLGTAPDELRDDLASLRTGFAAIDEAYGAVQYDAGATVSLPSEVLTANAVAAERLERHLVAECDLDTVRDRQVDDIAVAFGIEDLEVAACLHAQLGDVANIDSADLTPELMVAPVCDTSLLGLLSGEGESEG